MSQHQGTRGQCRTVRGAVFWESEHLGSGLVTATNSLGDNELGPLLPGASAYLYGKQQKLDKE